MTEIAKTFGDALYDLARDEGLTQEILSQLQVLAEALAAEKSFTTLLAAPSVPKEERCRILDESFRDKVHIYVLNFLKILTEKGYIRQFSGCCRAFRDRYNEDNGILPVRAVTASEIPQALKDRLEQKLRDVTGKAVDMTYAIDPDCIGGIRLDMDGTRLDGTVRHQLDGIRAALKSTVL